MARVYTLHTAEATDRDLAWAGGVLDAEERSRAARFVFAEHRRLFTLAHGMLRSVLARTFDIDPRVPTFSVGSHGKPSTAGVSFNLSHTNGLVAVAIGDGALGVDVEDSSARTDVLAVCDGFFSPYEVAALRALPESGQRERFFRYWTLKEAYIKARGLGLAIPLRDFSFDLSGPEIRVTLAPSIGDVADRWRFYQTTFDHHFLALCTEASDVLTTVERFVF